MALMKSLIFQYWTTCHILSSPLTCGEKWANMYNLHSGSTHSDIINKSRHPNQNQLAMGGTELHIHKAKQKNSLGLQGILESSENFNSFMDAGYS